MRPPRAAPATAAAAAAPRRSAVGLAHERGAAAAARWGTGGDGGEGARGGGVESARRRGHFPVSCWSTSHGSRAAGMTPCLPLSSDCLERIDWQAESWMPLHPAVRNFKQEICHSVHRIIKIYHGKAIFFHSFILRTLYCPRILALYKNLV